MKQTYRHKHTSVSLVNYHFIWCPRYRRKILRGEVDERLRELIRQISEGLELEVIALEIMPDHLHLFVNAPPTLSPHNIVARLKGVTSHHMRREFPEIARMSSMWTRSYFISTAGNVSSETVQRYIESQKKRG
jgi:putative transposase